MENLTEERFEQIDEAYRTMASAGYRPAAQSDGFGHITERIESLDICAEIINYAKSFVEEENEGTYWAGCTDFRSLKSAIWTLEAFRLMNGGQFWGFENKIHSGKRLVPALLKLALDHYNSIEWNIIGHVPAGRKPGMMPEFSPKQRFEILKRDGYRCQICGTAANDGPQVRLHVDHKTPLSRGGLSVLDNGWTLCKDCNLGKYVDEL